MDSTSYLTNKDLSVEKSTVFINFSPTCDHCERTIKSILSNISNFTTTQFVLTSFEDFDAIRKFYFENGLSSFSNIFVVQDTDYSLTRQIKYSSFPCLVLYDQENNYIKTIDEETNAKTLIKALKIKVK
jgi:copper chaperone CopZ